MGVKNEMFVTPPKKINPKLVWSTKDLINKSDSLIEEGFKLEAKGREIASHREELITEEDKQWSENIMVWHCKILDYMDTMAESFCSDEEKYKEYSSLSNVANCGQWVFASILDILPYITGEHRNITFPEITERITDFFVSTDELLGELIHYDNEQYQVTHRKGVWLYGVVPEEDYTYSAFINDATSVFHQFLNYLMHKFQNIVEIVPGRIYLVESGNPYLRDLALEWFSAAEFLNTMGLYSSEDYPQLRGFIRPSELQLVVGSAVGHVTHIEPRLRGIVATYYDTDESVHEVVMDLCDYYGIKLIEHEPGETSTFFAQRIDDTDSKFMRLVLPFVTSMDFRLNHPSEYWFMNYEEEYENLPEDLAYHAGQRGVEVQMCIIAGRDIQEHVPRA